MGGSGDGTEMECSEFYISSSHDEPTFIFQVVNRLRLSKLCTGNILPLMNCSITPKLFVGSSSFNIARITTAVAINCMHFQGDWGDLGPSYGCAKSTNFSFFKKKITTIIDVSKKNRQHFLKYCISRTA